MRLIPAFALLLTLQGLLTPNTSQAQDSTQKAWTPPYKMDIPTGWGTEHFSLPPGFAPNLPYHGMEDLRFSPGWADSISQEHWAYAFLWWLDGRPEVTAEKLKTCLEQYYNGLVGQNIAPRKIPAEKLVPIKVAVNTTTTAPGDKTTFAGTVHMLDYLTQTPMTLHILIHLKSLSTTDHTALFFEVSPRSPDHAVWQQMNAIKVVF